ncbi:MAG: Holliday junction resolvase RuvX [Candidatus Omnitrophota bacterium]
MRTLALDLGTKRIGLAISDGLGLTAQGLETIERTDERSLENVIKEREVTEIVIGLPLNMDGSKGERAEDAILFGEGLKNKFSIPVKMWDERLSTMFAEKEMIRGDLSRKKRKRLNDMLAAQLILQNYLDAKKSGTTER